MPSSIDLKRRDEETPLSYIKRLGELKDSGIINMTWDELAKVFNRELRENGEEFTESAYRKKYALMKKFNNEFQSVVVNSAEVNELKELRRELEKEKVKIRDERNEYRKLIRDEARKESYKEQFIRSVEEAAGRNPVPYSQENHRPIIRGNSVVVVPLTDIHLGIQIHNYWNDYDEDVFRHMLDNYCDRVIEIAVRHGAEDAVVLCSETMSGLIHESLRIQNNQDLIDQFLNVTDYICDFLYKLSFHFNNIDFYVAPGNHSRINPKKDQGLAKENMDCLLIPFIRAKMQNYQNIHTHENDVDSSIALFDVMGVKVAFVHGDKDVPGSAVKNISNMVGYKPDIIVMGHLHYNMYTTDNNTKIIQSGSFVGPDEYSVSRRLIGKPEQTVFIVNDNGLDCIYDIQL